MKTKITLLILLLSLISCSFFQNSLEYKETSEKFMNTLINKGPDESIKYFALESKMAKDINVDELKNGISNFRAKFIENFGKNIEYYFIKSEKKFSSSFKDKMIPNTTIVLIQFKNDKEFGVLQFLFDDNTKKILNFEPLNIKYPIPNLTLFYVIAIVALIVPVFNIYVLNLVRKSNLKRKWLKYIAIVLLNFPTLIYNAVEGFNFKVLQFSFLGYGFSKMGYLGSTISIGVPIVAIFWFWKLKLNNK